MLLNRLNGSTVALLLWTHTHSDYMIWYSNIANHFNYPHAMISIILLLRPRYVTYIYMNTTSVGLFYWFSCLSSILNDFVTTIYIFKLKRLMNYWDKLAEYITLRHNDGLVLVLSILMYWLTYARHGCKWPHNFFYCYSVLAVAQQKIVPAAAMIHICT